jgi:hypothetical protein
LPLQLWTSSPYLPRHCRLDPPTRMFGANPRRMDRPEIPSIQALNFGSAPGVAGFHAPAGNNPRALLKAATTKERMGITARVASARHTLNT